MAQGGDIEEVRVTHPTLGSRVFFAKAAEDNDYDLGGFRNEDDENMIDGSGELIVKKNRKRGYLQVVLSIDQDVREDDKFLNDIAESTDLADWTWSVVTGRVYGGKGTIVGDIQPNQNASTCSIKVAFGGRVQKIA